MGNNKIIDKRIGVLMGGLSTERDVSLKTGEAVFETLKDAGLDVVLIDVDRDIATRLKEERIELAFIALHGQYGEDGAIQGLLELMGTPYTGSGILGNALSLNKIIAKELLRCHDIMTPDFCVVKRDEFFNSRGFSSHLDLPFVVKPVSQGSTIGISIVKDKADIDSAVRKAFEYEDEIFIERYIDGILIAVGILGERPLPIIEIHPGKGFYDYLSKYTKGMTEYIVPARLEGEKYLWCQSMALNAHNVLCCKGVSRVDIIVGRDGRPYVLEVNTIPGMTETSLLPMAAKEMGLSFRDLVTKMLEMAVERR
ncbi:MAG: D-alanine--D-alanine ligase [Nitrospinota bacterium]